MWFLLITSNYNEFDSVWPWNNSIYSDDGAFVHLDTIN